MRLLPPKSIVNPGNLQTPHTDLMIPGKCKIIILHHVVSSISHDSGLLERQALTAATAKHKRQVVNGRKLNNPAFCEAGLLYVLPPELWASDYPLALLTALLSPLIPWTIMSISSSTLVSSLRKSPTFLPCSSTMILSATGYTWYRL